MEQTTTDRLLADGLVTTHGSPFGLPIGFKGRLAGWYMSFPDRQHREIATIVPLPPRSRVLEIGIGPGQLLRMLRRREPSIQGAGVDPSGLMVAAARRRNRGADIHLGAAASLPFGDGSADVVIAVNNVRMWPDVGAALREIRRVLADDGHLLIAWHGGTEPIGHQRQLVLSAARLAELDAAVAEVFPSATRRTLHHSELWSTAP